MSVKNILDKTPIGIENSKLPFIADVEPNIWIRPVDWLPLPTVTNTEDKIVGLFAIYPGGRNYVAFKATTSTGGNYLVDWGNGSTSTVLSNNKAEYLYDFNSVEFDGTLTSENFKQTVITITPETGNFTTIEFDAKHTDETLSSFTEWRDILVSGPSLTSIILNRQSFTNIIGLRQFQLISTNSISSFNDFFKNCSSLVSVPLFIANSATTVTSMFSNCSNLESIPATTATTGLHFGICQNFSNMFSGCIKLKKLFTPSFDTSTGKIFTSMFSACYTLASIPQLDFKGISLTNIPANYRYASSMFYNCISLRGSQYIDLSNINIAVNIFEGCSALENIVVNLGSSAIQLNAMFKNCKALISAKITGNVSGVTQCNEMFDGCSSLRTAPYFNFNTVDTCYYMYRNCTSLQKVPPYDFSNVRYTYNIFEGCTSLTQVPSINLLNGVTIHTMFKNCKSLIKGPNITFPDNPSFSNLGNFFEGCSSLQSIPNYNFKNTTNFTSIFSGCNSLIDVPNLDFSKATTLTRAFEYCYTLKNVPTFIMPNTGTCNSSYMFLNCSALKFVNNIDTSKLSTTENMFQNCTNLEFIPLFDLTSCTNVTNMFNGCSQLKLIPAINFNNVTSASSFANNCYSLSRTEALNHKVSVSYNNCSLTEPQLIELLNNLKSSVSGQSLTITNNPIPSALSYTCTLVSGSTTVTLPSTSGLTVGMQVTGTSTSLTHSSNSVSFASGDLVVKTGHPLIDGDEVCFNTITGTSSISANTIYYVVNSTTNNFQIASTVGGSPLTLSPPGSGNMRYRTHIAAINPNVSITLSKPALGAGSSSLVFRTLPTWIAILKGWTILG